MASLSDVQCLVDLNSYSYAQKLHSVTEILILHSELEASYRASEENSRIARSLNEAQLLESQRQRRHRREIRQEIRLRKRRL